MAKKLFGTDGIRGVAGEAPLDAATAHALGFALGTWACRTDAHPGERSNPQVLVGMDTRESGPWLAEQVAGGLAEAGIGVRFAGVMTTPGVAYLTRTGTFVAGVMISASHNPFQDNGLKVFAHSGYKLPDVIEEELEGMMDQWLASGKPAAAQPLQVDRALENLYEQYLLGTVNGKLPFRVAIDCANGSAAKIAPGVFPALGVDAEWIGREPNGRNINLECGSLHLDNLRAAVFEKRVDLGIAFDGDADRALFVSGSGRNIDGDAVLFLTGSALNRAGKLNGSVVVATVMSNLGLQKALASEGITMLRTPVGDKYVLEEMLKTGAVLGGEQSGHVIFSEHATTGDGILTALRVLEVLRDTGKSLDDLADAVPVFPQKLVNVRVKSKRPLAELDTVQQEIRAAEQDFGASGRIVVRFSGTEPLARVMIEGDSEERVSMWTERIADAIRAELGSAV